MKTYIKIKGPYNKSSNAEAHYRGMNIYGQWVYGNLVRDGENAYLVNIKNNGDDLANEIILKSSKKVDVRTICQFTGFTMSESKIYQGDIIEITKDDEYDDNGDKLKYRTYIGFDKFCSVEWSNDSAYDSMSFDDLWFSDDNIEVIGNVFENYELLENKQS